jgi:pilus assembly protein CpaB
VRASTLIMIGFAVVFGLLAVFVAQTWLNNQAEMRAKNLEAQKKAVPTRTIVVASRPLRFGSDLSAANLREIAWPEEALPAGSFSKISEVTSEGRRIALTAVEPNEPILNSKITGPGQRATLSAVIQDGMKAVTIRVNDVDGVGGFVLPGDHVDIVLTRQGDKSNALNDVVLQSTRVLAIDQIADERSDKPTVAKSVTLEVNTAGAQKLALASSVGTLSLMLRKAGEAHAESTRRITLNDIGTVVAPMPPPVAKTAAKKTTTVSVTRSAVKKEYRVPIEGAGSHRATTSGEDVAAEE